MGDARHENPRRRPDRRPGARVPGVVLCVGLAPRADRAGVRLHRALPEPRALVSGWVDEVRRMVSNNGCFGNVRPTDGHEQAHAPELRALMAVWAGGQALAQEPRPVPVPPPMERPDAPPRPPEVQTFAVYGAGTICDGDHLVSAAQARDGPSCPVTSSTGSGTFHTKSA
jgi:hypothetical protein